MAFSICIILLFVISNYNCISENASNIYSNDNNDHSNGNNNNKFQLDKNYTLSSIDDVEMLTYFLLWKYDYFNNTPNSIDNNQDANNKKQDLDSLNEARLREFIEKLKINHLITNTPSLFDLKKTCTNETFQKLSKQKWWPQNSFEKTKLICEAASSCKNAKSLIELVGLSSFRTPTLSQSIARLCPLMLFQLQEKECVDQQESQFKARNKPSLGNVCFYGLLFVTIVSACSVTGVGILRFFDDQAYHLVMTMLEGLAVGSLVGSALFHLIPQAFNLVIPGNYEYLWRALIIFGGIYLFFWSERIMKIIAEYRRNKKSNKDVSVPSSTSLEQNDLQNQRQVCFQNSKEPTIEIINNGGEMIASASTVEAETTLTTMPYANGIEHDHENLPRRERTNSSFLAMKHDHFHAHGDGEIATIAWMIIFGDGLHNLIDGITIGAAFSQSILEGISISVAVICEEFPHELGDFAVLLNSGMSMRTAIKYNLLSACTCYLGLVIGIALGDLSYATPYVFALAGGVFLYISLVGMMGELSSKLDKSAKRGIGHTALIFLLQNIGILIGVSIMFVLAMYNDRINFDGLVPPNNSDMPFTES